jgi:hypothetical protein
MLFCTDKIWISFSCMLPSIKRQNLKPTCYDLFHVTFQIRILPVLGKIILARQLILSCMVYCTQQKPWYTAYFSNYPMCVTINDCNIYSQYIVHFAVIIIRWTLLFKKAERERDGHIHLSDSLPLVAYITRNLWDHLYSFIARHIHWLQMGRKWPCQHCCCRFSIVLWITLRWIIQCLMQVPWNQISPAQFWFYRFLFESQLYSVTFTEQT